MRSLVLAMLGLLGASACTEDEPPPVPTGPTYQYVVGEIQIPANNTQARDNGLDLNKDGSIDNQLGMVFGTLSGVGFGVGETANEALVRGNALLLVELQTGAFDATAASGLQTGLGANPDPTACTDTTKLETCGRQFAVRAHYDRVGGGDSDLGVAPFEDGRLLAPISTLPITIGIDPTAPLRVDLRAAKVQLTDVSADGATAIIAGGIAKADLDGVVIPEVARNVARIEKNDCDPARTTTACGCTDGSRGALLERYFDTDHDCAIALTEVANSSLIESLFHPDLGKGDDAMLSFGVGAQLVPAAF